MKKLEVLYNSECPICSREIKHYERISAGDISFIEITAASALEWGLSEDQAAKQIHARYEGHLVVELMRLLSCGTDCPIIIRYHGFFISAR